MNDFFGMNRFDAVTEVIGKYNVPILFDVDLGHLPPSMPIITGRIGTIEFKNKQLTLKMELK
jgi:muramoyltetrapeptide carboxypeptidase LdcA involved in peptidoglycan recycling